MPNNSVAPSLQTISYVHTPRYETIILQYSTLAISIILIMLFILQVVRLLDGTEEEWEISRSEIELGEKLGQGNYGAVFKGRLTVAAMTPMISAHKKEMDFEGKSHLDVAVKMLRRKCSQLTASAHHYLLGLLACAHTHHVLCTWCVYMSINLYKDGSGCVCVCCNTTKAVLPFCSWQKTRK